MPVVSFAAQELLACQFSLCHVMVLAHSLLLGPLQNGVPSSLPCTLPGLLSVTQPPDNTFVTKLTAK